MKERNWRLEAGAPGTPGGVLLRRLGPRRSAHGRNGRRTILRAETEPWWRQAEADVGAAEWNAEGGLYYVVSWFAQQAAEKALKALWIERRVEEPPRTHAVQFLGRELGVPPSVQADLDVVAPVFGQARYPELGGPAPVDSISASAAGEHLAAARRILVWTAQQLQPPSNPR